MTCCATGKARVYYNIPEQGSLKYRLKGSTNWITLKGDFTHTCTPRKEEPLIYGVWYKDPRYYTDYNLLSSYLFTLPITLTQTQTGTSDFAPRVPLYTIRVTGANGVTWAATRHPDLLFKWDLYPNRNQDLPGYSFTISDKYTGSEHSKTFVEECPDVQTIPCKFNPAKEQYIDVELANFDASILRKIKGFPKLLPTKLRDCIDIVTKDNAIQIRKIGQIGYESEGTEIWIPTGLFSVIMQIESPEGCPPPQTRVVCCTTPDCQEDKKCPKETTCEIVCNGFKCCYSKGVLIRSIKL